MARSGSKAACVVWAVMPQRHTCPAGSVVNDPIAAIMTAAEAMGAAAKPSDAGGGDVAIAFGADPDLGARIAGQTGTSLVAIAIDPGGVTVA